MTRATRSHPCALIDGEIAHDDRERHPGYPPLLCAKEEAMSWKTLTEQLREAGDAGAESVYSIRYSH